jgi:hypothetical protein
MKPMSDLPVNTSINAAGFTWQQSGVNGWCTKSGPLLIKLRYAPPHANPYHRPPGWYVTCMHMNIHGHSLRLDVTDALPVACRYAIEHLKETLQETLDLLEGDPKLVCDEEDGE